MNILISNDDGIRSEGIQILAEFASTLGDVYVVAPNKQYSGASQQIHLHCGFTAVPYDMPGVKAAWMLNGSPADCVQGGIRYILPVRPDICFTGINLGYNAGFDAAYSGTVGAARESLIQGVPAMAFSGGGDLSVSFPLAKAFLPEIVKELLNRPIQKNELWNVNFPDRTEKDLKGIRWDVGIAPANMYRQDFTMKTGQDGSIDLERDAYLIRDVSGLPENSDVVLLKQGYITAGKVASGIL